MILADDDTNGSMTLIDPVIEKYKFDEVNDALDRLRSGEARYRIVLSRD